MALSNTLQLYFEKVETIEEFPLLWQQSLEGTLGKDIIEGCIPEKLTFEGLSYRTSRLNEAVEPIYKPGIGFQ